MRHVHILSAVTVTRDSVTYTVRRTVVALQFNSFALYFRLLVFEIMAKKKRTTTKGKPITDFFTLASKSHPPPKIQVSSSIPSQASSSGESGI